MSIVSVLRKQCLIFAHMNNNELESLVNSSRQLAVKASDIIVEIGSPADHAYVVLEGQLASVINTDSGDEHILQTFEVGHIPGEMELEEEADFQTSIKATQDTQLLKITRNDFLQAVTSHEKSIIVANDQSHEQVSQLLIAKYLDNIFRSSRLAFKNDELKHQLEKEWLEFEDTLLEGLKKSVEWTVLKRGEYLFNKGDDADGAYILVSGVLGVTMPQDDGKETELARVYHGEIVGELALVTDEKRSANIKALRDCELFKLSTVEFNHIGEKFPRMMLGVYQTISERFIQSRLGKKYRPKRPNIAIFNLQKSDRINNFLEQFIQHLSSQDATQVLTSERVDRHLGSEGIANISREAPGNIGLMHWLNRREVNSRFVLYRPDDTWTEWSRRCVSQADQIVIFADVESQPDFTQFINQVLPTGQSWKLVLIHPENTERPRNSAEWLQASKAEQILHARENNTDDCKRVIRILSGRALSLVLGGGGARGFAHIGVLRALQEMGLSIDMIGAASIGAPIAGWFAQGKSAIEIKKLSIKAFSNLIDLTLPMISLIRGKKISRVINQETADWDIEDYWRPFFCVSTNLTHARQVVHMRGNSALACRASVSIPGVLPPVPSERSFLVDGGVLNNLPIDIMREQNPSGIVLAIDVVSPNGSTVKNDYGQYFSGWRQLFRLLNPFLKPIKVPALGSIVMQSMIIGSSVARTRALQQQLADFYLNIHVRGVSLLAFNKVNQAEEVGYQQSIEPLKDWIKKSQYKQL